MKAPRRKFTIYELQKLASKGDPDYDKYHITRQFDDPEQEPELEPEGPEPPPQPQYEPPDIVGKKIDVKFYDSGDKSLVVDKQSIARRKKSSGTFYEGKVLSYDDNTLEHKVRFYDGRMELNFTDKGKPDYIAPGSGWRLAK
eukprot:SAG11_NODE_6659_length_1272_cov_0.735720_1_plen_142_part_00